MKFPIVYFLIVMVACSNNNTAGKTHTGNTSSTDNSSAQVSAANDNGITGEWELAGITEDTNGNDQLDPDERSRASKTAMDYMKLNPDGSAVFFYSNIKGRYEIRSKETGGKKYLYLYDQQNFEYPKGYIMSVTKNELLIMHQSGGNSITIWKKV
jgi:hypothetical protein